MTTPVTASSTIPTSNDSAFAGQHASVAQPIDYYLPAPTAPGAPGAPSRSGLPWFIAGGTLLGIAICHLMLLPEWVATKTSDGVIGNLTGVLAEVGIGAALLAVGVTRRRQHR